MNREKTNPDAPDIATGTQDGADVVEGASAESFPSRGSGESTGSVESDIERAARAEESEKADLENRLLRALAELENFRRRAERERMEAVRFAAAQLIEDLLPTADNLSRALDSLPADRLADENTVQQFRAGIVATERVLQEAFAKHGISKIQPLFGDPLDPHRHQALTEVEQSDYPRARSSEFCCRATPITSGCCARLWSSSPSAGANRRRQIEAAAGHLCRTSGSFRILRR